MSEQGREEGAGEPLNIGRPGKPQDATPGGQSQGNAQLGERGTASGGAAGTGETDEERDNAA